MPLKDFLLKKGIDIVKNKENYINKIGKEAYDKEHKANVKRMYKYKAQEAGEDYSDSDEEEIPKTNIMDKKEYLKLESPILKKFLDLQSKVDKLKSLKAKEKHYPMLNKLKTELEELKNKFNNPHPVIKKILPKVHKDLDKYIKDFDLSIDKSLKPKKRLMRTMKIVEPKKTTIMTTKIVKPEKKRNFMTTSKIVEFKPKEHELNKVVELLEKLNQSKEIINAIKYVKNFIKNN